MPGELFGALRGRLYDSNKNLVMTTLTTIGGVASAMGSAVEKSSKVYELLMDVKNLFILSCKMLKLFLIWFLSGHSVRYFEMSW